MTANKLAKLGGIVLALLLIVVAWSVFGGKEQSPEPAAQAGTEKAKQDNTGPASGKKEKKIKYWVAPMDPTYIRDKPGKSPMGMDLVPVYEGDDESGPEGVIKIDPVTVQDIGVRTAKVTRGPLYATVRTVGHVTYNEEKVEHIHTKFSGYVEKLFVDTTGEEVRKGQKLMSIYSPELVATQEEYLQALKFAKKTADSAFEDVAEGGNSLLEATRRRLLLMDIDPGQIKALEDRGEVQKTMILNSPSAGVVIDKKVLEGMKISPGMELYTIADLSKVWVIGSIYEYELPLIRTGQEAEITLPYDPGVTLKGRVSFIYPYLSPETRTAQIRIEFRNPGFRLKPDMYADVLIKTKVASRTLQVPSESVIRTGTRNVVITSIGEGKFLPKEVVVGTEANGMVQIKSGLAEGDTVVTSGQFLIDSESNLKQAINKMLEERKAPAPGKPGEPEAADAKTASTAKKPEDKTPALRLDLSKEQKAIMTSMMNDYLQIHDALVAGSMPKVKSGAEAFSAELKKLVSSDAGGKLKTFTDSLSAPLKRLTSDDLKTSKDSYKLLSRTMVGYVKGTGAQEAKADAVKIYFCPMVKEHWLQKGNKIENPFLGKDMLLCGTEVKY